MNVGQLDYDKFSPLLPENKQNLINKFVNERQGRSVHELNQGATLSELVSGLNKLSVWPDLILHNMKSVDALDAVIEVK